MHGDRALNRIFQSGTIQVILNAEFYLPMTKTNLHIIFSFAGKIIKAIVMELFDNYRN